MTLSKPSPRLPLSDVRPGKVYNADHRERSCREATLRAAGAGTLPPPVVRGAGFREEMRRTLTALLGLVFLFGGAGTSRAEVRRVRMRIAGYLCGN